MFAGAFGCCDGAVGASYLKICDCFYHQPQLHFST
jgi:hypothetical protein